MCVNTHDIISLWDTSFLMVGRTTGSSSPPPPKDYKVEFLVIYGCGSRYTSTTLTKHMTQNMTLSQSEVMHSGPVVFNKYKAREACVSRTCCNYLFVCFFRFHLYLCCML